MLLEKVNNDVALTNLPFDLDFAVASRFELPVLATPAAAATFCPAFVKGFGVAAAATAAFTAGFGIGQAIGK